MMILGSLNSSVPFVGPIDIVASPSIAASLRGLSGAIVAGGTQKLVQVRRGSDSATADIIVASNGGFGLTANASAGSNNVSVSTWGGVSATGTGSISGTSLTFTGGLIGSQVTGSGVLAGTIVISGSSPNWTVNQSQTVGSTTLTLANSLFVAKMYGQGSTTVDFGNTLGSRQPYLALNVFNSGTLPGMYMDGSVSGRGLESVVTTTSQPTSASCVVERLKGAAIMEFYRYNANMFLRATASANQYTAAAGLGIQYTVSDGALHAVQTVFNGASGAINIDGTDSTAQNYGTNSALTPLSIGSTSGTTSEWLDGFFNELVVWNSTAISPTDRANLHANQSAYWGTP